MRKEQEWIRWKKKRIRIGWNNRKSKKDRQNRMADPPAAAYRPDTAGGGRNRFPRTAVPARPALPDPLARLA